MSKRFNRGLVVGKFSPLHHGHELVINRAFEECAEVFLLCYSKPELPGCDVVRREQWLSARFPTASRLVVSDDRLKELVKVGDGPREVPHNNTDERTHRRFCGFLCERVLGVTVDAVFTSEDYGEGFAAELTRYFRKRNPTLPAVKHILVDKDRLKLPISGTQLRRDVHAHRDWLAPEVYASFVERVCLLGYAPIGSGGGSSVSSSWASSSLSASYFKNAETQINDGQLQTNFITNNGAGFIGSDSQWLISEDVTITGNLIATASWANNVKSASYSTTSSNAVTASFAKTASHAPLYLLKVGDTTTNPTLNFTSSGNVFEVIRATSNGLECYCPGADSNAFWTVEDTFHAGYIVASAIEGPLTGDVNGSASYAAFAQSSSQAISSSILTNGQSTVLPKDDSVRVIAGGASSFVFGDVGSTVNASVLPLTAPSFTGSLKGTASYAGTAYNVNGGVVTASLVLLTDDVYVRPTGIANTMSIVGQSSISTGPTINLVGGHARTFFNTSYAGGNINIHGGSGSYGTGLTNSGFGGHITLFGGHASGSTGDATPGGDVVLRGGNGFGTGSAGVVRLLGVVSASVITASLFYGSASFAQTASWALNAINGGTSLSTGSTYPITSSWANNGVTASYVSPVQPYVTVTTSSTNWITCSFTNPVQQITLNQTGSYSLTASNMPSTGYVADVVLYVSHSTVNTSSSLSWPSTWIPIGNSLPSLILGNKFAVVWLHATDNNTVLASYTVQP